MRLAVFLLACARMSVDSIPIWALLPLTIVVVLIALESGVRLGRATLRRGGGKLEVSGAMIGATMGLLAFMLAFTFNSAAVRYEARKSLVIKEANAIEVAWLRAAFLTEPHRSEVRSRLRDYVALRVRAVSGSEDLAGALRKSEQMQEELWAVAAEAGQKEPGSIVVGLFAQSVNDVIDLHLERVTVGIRARIVPSIWITLFLLLAAGMLMIGTQVGLGSGRHVWTEAALAVSFSLVLFLIADLDRPQQGLIAVSQQAMQELLVKLDHK